MSTNLKDTQLFLKGMLLERIQNPGDYKEYRESFGLDLIDYDLNDNDILQLTNIIVETSKFESLKVRLSDSLKDKKLLIRFLKKFILKRQFSTLCFYIKYLNDELLDCFIDALNKLDSKISTLEITIKYRDIQKEEEVLKKILENLLKNENSGINLLVFKSCRFSSQENLDLLNKYIEKNQSKKLERVSFTRRRFLKDTFTPNISSLKRVDFIYCYLNYLNYLPLEVLNLSCNNISKDCLNRLVDLLKEEKCTLYKLNLRYNYIGDEGAYILSESLKYNKSLISLNVSGNNILNSGLISFANNIKSEFNTTLKKFIFRDNSIDDNGISEFCKILKDEPENRFIKLDFSVNYFKDLGLCDYGRLLGKNPKIKKLILTDRFGEDAKNNFFIYCQTLVALNKLSFYSIDLSPNTTTTLNNILLNNYDIESINFSTNRTLGPEGVNNLLTGIEHNLKLKELSLPSCNIGDEGAEVLSKALFKNIYITEINLEYNQIGENGIRVLSEKIFCKICIKKLVLGHNLINSKATSYLAESLKQCLNLETLLLNSNDIKDEGCDYLAQGLEKNIALIEINLDNNGITSKGMINLAKVLNEKYTLMSLGLSSNQINEIEGDFADLFDWLKVIKIADNPLFPLGVLTLFKDSKENRMMKKIRFKSNDKHTFNNIKYINDNLKVFDLSYNEKINHSLMNIIFSLTHLSILHLQKNDVQDKDIEKMVHQIKQFNPPLKEFLLHNNQIGVEGSKSLAELIKDNKNLRTLNLADNPLLNEGVKNICESVIKNENVLEELSLSYTKCNDYAADIISKLLRVNKIRSLSLIGNRFSNKGIDTILSSLRSNNTLRELYLGNKFLDSNAFINLADYLKYNSSLMVLEIKSSKMEDEILKKLSKTLEFNKTLVNINFSDNHLGYEGIATIGQHISKNRTIYQVKVLLNMTNRDEEPLLKSCNSHIVFN